MELVKEISHVLLSSIVSIIVLFLLTKIMGYRQLTQLSFFDYIIGITIGSIAAEMATDLENDWWKPLVAMIVYSLGAVGVSMLALKSIKARRWFTGAPLILIYNGKIIHKNMKKARYDMNDLLSEARTDGYFDLSEIAFAIMEHTGKVSFLPKAENKPCTNKDANILVSPSNLCANLIVDGEIMTNTLSAVGKNEIWLKEQLKELKLSAKDLALATYDGNRLIPFKYEKDKKGNDIFM